ncbi:MAG: hypothetical protein Q4G38_00450, partial [Aeriscardovia aeriphila]|nr:hypothetical protein [Aeriscardovia aeriphila]
MTTSETRENMTTSSAHAPVSAHVPTSTPHAQQTTQKAGEGMHIVAVDRFYPADRQMMEASIPDARFTWLAPKSEHLPADATAVVGNFPVAAVQELFTAQSHASAPRLQLIQLLSAGYDKYM